jgi:hypothetical protein
MSLLPRTTLHSDNEQLLTTSTECFDPHYSSNVCYDPSEFIVHPGHGGDPRVDEQLVHLLCDTLTHVHVFFVHWVELSQHSDAETRAPVHNGMLHNGTEYNGTLHNGTFPNGTFPNGTLQNGMLQNSMLQSCKLQNSTALRNGIDTKWYIVLKR